MESFLEKDEIIALFMELEQMHGAAMEREMADQRVFITRTRPRWRPDRGGDPSRRPGPPPGRAPRPTLATRPSQPSTSISRAWFRTPCKRHRATRTDLRPTPCGPHRVIECRPRCCRRRRPIVPWPETFVSTRGDDGGFAGTALYPPSAASRSVQHRRPRNCRLSLPRSPEVSLAGEFLS